MLTSKKIFLSIFSCIFICVTGCFSASPKINLGKSEPSSLPIRGLSIRLDLTQREKFFSQLRKFADKHSLEFSLTFFDADEESFFVVMYGDNFHIVCNSMSNHPEEVAINFYTETTFVAPPEVVDELMGDLKSFIVEIPSLSIIEER